MCIYMDFLDLLYLLYLNSSFFFIPRPSVQHSGRYLMSFKFALQIKLP